MGFFGSSTPATPTPPMRSQRALCWEARDAFFACLDTNGIVDAIKGAAAAKEKCGELEKKFEKECVGSWVEYFKKKRTMEIRKERMLKGLDAEGANKVDIAEERF